MNTGRKSIPVEPSASSMSEKKIPLSAPSLAGNEWKYVKECLDTGWVSSVGNFVNRFERETSRYVGAHHAVAVSNGTAALHTGLRVLGVEAGDEVIVPSFAFVAAANAVVYCGAEPVFMDVDPSTWHIDVNKLAAFLESECELTDGQCIHKKTGKRLRAILPVHILGMACEIDRIVELARKYNLKVLEDAAEAIGVRYRGRSVGTFGDIGVFSYNGNKIMTTGGGGMLVTDIQVHAERARYLTTQAKSNPTEYVHDEVGYNYRMTNLQAAMGVAQLEQLDQFIERKRCITRAYKEGLGDLAGIRMMPDIDNCEPTYWLYTILLPEGTTLEKRRDTIERLNRAGVEARSLWHPLHDLPPYAHCQAYEIEVAPRLFERAVSLPSSVGMSDAVLERCISLCRQNLV
jgi:perosamine synthetase